MTKTLLLLRHGEADNAPRDIDRPLSPRGHAMAIYVHKELVTRQLMPQKILCSPAKRTRETCAGIIAGVSPPPSVEYLNDLYGATLNDVLKIVGREDAERIMVIGHNPWVHALAISLASPAELNKHREMKTMFPPASCAVLQFTGNVETGMGTLDYFYPAGNSDDW